MKACSLLLAILIVFAGCSGVLSAFAQNTGVQIQSFGTIRYLDVDPVRYVDFETGDFSQVPPGDTNGDNDAPKIVTDRVHSGVYAAPLQHPVYKLYTVTFLSLFYMDMRQASLSLPYPLCFSAPA